jgi:hypothetical protein
MKTLADVKRRLQVGAVVEMTYHRFAVADGKPLPPPRKVALVQSNAVAFEATDYSNGRLSWLYWPKASEVHVQGDEFAIFEPLDPQSLSAVMTPVMVYRVIG